MYIDTATEGRLKNGNVLIDNGDRYQLARRVKDISLQHCGAECVSKAYFMGILDMSYASFIGKD